MYPVSAYMTTLLIYVDNQGSYLLQPHVHTVVPDATSVFCVTRVTLNTKKQITD